MIIIVIATSTYYILRKRKWLHCIIVYKLLTAGKPSNSEVLLVRPHLRPSKSGLHGKLVLIIIARPYYITQTVNMYICVKQTFTVVGFVSTKENLCFNHSDNNAGTHMLFSYNWEVLHIFTKKCIKAKTISLDMSITYTRVHVHMYYRYISSHYFKMYLHKGYIYL